MIWDIINGLLFTLIAYNIMSMIHNKWAYNQLMKILKKTNKSNQEIIAEFDQYISFKEMTSFKNMFIFNMDKLKKK